MGRPVTMNMSSPSALVAPFDSPESWLNMALSYFYPFFGIVFMVFVSIAIVSAVSYKLHEHDLLKTLSYYRTPQSGQRAMDDKPFRKFMLRCMNEWHYTMLSCISIVL